MCMLCFSSCVVCSGVTDSSPSPGMAAYHRLQGERVSDRKKSLCATYRLLVFVNLVFGVMSGTIFRLLFDTVFAALDQPTPHNADLDLSSPRSLPISLSHAAALR